MEPPVPPDLSIFKQIWANIESILFVIFVSSMTGVAAYLNKIRKDWTAFEWKMLALSFLTGGINGYLTFLACDYAQFSWQTTAILTGASGGAGWELLKYIIGRSKSSWRNE